MILKKKNIETNITTLNIFLDKNKYNLQNLRFLIELKTYEHKL